MRQGTKRFCGQLVFALCCIGCSRVTPSKEDSYIVVKHDTEGDRYVIRHGNVEIHATCRYSTYTVKGDNKTSDAFCLESLPVGQKLRMSRGAGDWLFCDWEIRDAEWHMGLSVEKEEVK
jgi:hypothetical protein